MKYLKRFEEKSQLQLSGKELVNYLNTFFDEFIVTEDAYSCYIEHKKENVM